MAERPSARETARVTAAGGTRTARLELAARPDTARRARRFLRDRMREWRLGVQADVALLLVSELVNNAVLHARTDIAVVVHVAGGRLRVAVHDGSPADVRIRRGGGGDAGRGLLLVERLSDGWGVERTGSGKGVWFELRLAA
jgi:anti-sigma regulatory factor (Ser/Thr protein kinase)